MRRRCRPAEQYSMNFLKGRVQRVRLALTTANRELGASMVEYGLMVSLVAVIAIPAVAIVGHETSDRFESVAAASGGEGGGPSDQTPTTLGQTGTSQGPGGSGNPGGGGATTTTTQPSTTTTTLPPTTTTTLPATTTTTSAPAPGGSTTVATRTSSDFYWFNKSKNGGEGAWKATVGFKNDWIRHQYLTLEVTRIDATGKRTTTTVTDFYVPAGGSASYDAYDNALKIDGANKTGVVNVEVKVVSIKTADEKWQTMTYTVNGPATAVTAPTIP